jgi:hypothetical protein
VHGLHGTSRDLASLAAALGERDEEVLTLAVAANEGRTTDGVLAGAERVARDVTSTVASNPSLRRISFVGNSLGGLYARSAIAQLHDGGQGTRVAGLEPEAFVTIASPHLGTRLLAWVPPPIHGLTPLFAGRSASDLFLKNGVLAAMTDEPHLRALSAFRRRVAYANARGDLMVPPYTSAIDGERRGLDQRERLMAEQLRSVPWRTVHVHWPSLALPITHNMICALSRDPVSRALYRRGSTVVADVAQTIVASREGEPQHGPTTETLNA